MRYYLLTILFSAISFCSFGQNVQLIHGQVFDNKKHPLEGAIISNYTGDQMGVTDANGQFSINSAVYCHTIAVSCEGFYSEVVKVDGSYLTIKLRPSTVVIGDKRMTIDEWDELKSQRREERKTARQRYVDSMAVVRAEQSAARQRYVDSMALVRAEQSARIEREAVNSAGGAVNMPLNNDVQQIKEYEWVDLGLSVKWATCNVGANSPEDYGNYYAWGETTTKSSYTEDNSKTYDKSLVEIGGNILYDVATVNRGTGWRIPTQEEFNELIDNCKWRWATRNGVKGYEVKSKKNGNSIFLPVAGYCTGDTPSNQGSSGCYWSSTPYGIDGAYRLNLSFYGRRTDWIYRNIGHSVRPVAE